MGHIDRWNEMGCRPGGHRQCIPQSLGSGVFSIDEGGR